MKNRTKVLIGMVALMVAVLPFAGFGQGNDSAKCLAYQVDPFGWGDAGGDMYPDGFDPSWPFGWGTFPYRSEALMAVGTTISISGDIHLSAGNESLVWLGVGDVFLGVEYYDDGGDLFLMGQGPDDQFFTAAIDSATVLGGWHNFAYKATVVDMVNMGIYWDVTFEIEFLVDGNVVHTETYVQYGMFSADYDTLPPPISWLDWLSFWMATGFDGEEVVFLDNFRTELSGTAEIDEPAGGFFVYDGFETYADGKLFDVQWLWEVWGDSPDVTSKIPQTPPVAACASGVFEIPVGGTADIDAAAGSYDPDGDPITIVIDPVGPYAAGTHNVTVTVADDTSLRSTCQGTFIVHSAPVAVCQDVAVEVDEIGGTADVSVDAGSSDPDGDAITVVQDPAGPYGEGETIVTLTVTDANGAVDTCTALVTVTGPQPSNLPPIANCADVTVVDMDDDGVEAVAAETLATGSYDPDNDPITVTADPAGPYAVGQTTVTITVTDPLGETDTCTAIVTVEPKPNTPPVAACQDVTVAAGSDCTATASVDAGSYDPDGDAVTIVQTPAGPYGLGQTVVTLTITDSEGATDSCQAIVKVTTQVEGFLAPLNAALVPVGDTPAVPQKKVNPKRKCLPLKLKVLCGTTELTDADMAAMGMGAPRIVSIMDCDGSYVMDEEEIDSVGNANDGVLFRYADSVWIYNLDTTGLRSGKMYQIKIRLGDGQELLANFEMK